MLQEPMIEKYIQKIRDLREDHDLSQTAVAKLLYVAQTTYSDYENGKIRIPVDCIIELARYYDVDMNYITGMSKIKKPFPKS